MRAPVEAGSPVARETIRAQARALKMPGLLRAFEELARQAREERWGFEDYLHETLAAEESSRHDSAVRNRIRAARFPDIKTLQDFDFGTAGESVSPTVIAELARGEWIDRGHNVIFAGPIGTGKTHLAIALGVEAARQRRHVFFVRAADLVRQLLEARDDRDLSRFHRKLARTHLLIIDELGFVPFDRAGGELLFNVVSDRYQRRSLLVTTNLSFAEWVTVFGGDEKLTTALLDRLAEHATIITTKGKSYRMRKRHNRQQSAQDSDLLPTPDSSK